MVPATVVTRRAPPTAQCLAAGARWFEHGRLLVKRVSAPPLPGGFLKAMRFLPLLLVAAGAAACDAADGSWKRYSISPDESRELRRDFSSTSGVRLKPLFSIGRPDGDEDQLFGMVYDADMGPDGSVYVVDVQFKQVSVYDSTGTFKRRIGRTGSGPGEFLAPAQIVVFDSLFAVYDEQLGRVSVFDTAGNFRRAFPSSRPFSQYLDRAPGGGLLLTAVGDSSRVFHLDLAGGLVAEHIRPPPADTLIEGPYGIEPGRACAQSSEQLLYVNPWIYETAAIAPRSGELLWVKRRASEVLRPQPSDVEGVRTSTRRAALLGLVCTPRYTLLAYLDTETRRLFYDFLDAEGSGIARLVFTQGPGREFPGFAGGGRGDRLVTFRTRPYSQVFVYRVEQP